MKKNVIIAFVVICGCCCGFADELSDKYMDIACDRFSNLSRLKEVDSELSLLANETSDPYDKAAMEELAFIYSDPMFKKCTIGILEYFVSGPIWDRRPKRETIDSAFEANKPIMDIDLACDIAYYGRNYGDFDGYSWDIDLQDVATRKTNVMHKRLELRKKFLGTRGSQADADSAAIEYMRSNMAPIRRIFRTAERESAIVVSIAPSFKMYKFLWVVSLLGGRVETLVSPDSAGINWAQFNEIEDWFWINQYKIDESMIENAESLCERLQLPFFLKFDSFRYEVMLSDELYKEIVKQVAAKGIIPLQDCELSQFRK